MWYYFVFITCSGGFGSQPDGQPYVLQPAGLAVYEPATQMRVGVLLMAKFYVSSAMIIVAVVE